MAFKMRGWSAFTKEPEPKADMPEVTVTPTMQENRDYSLKDLGKDILHTAGFGVPTKKGINKIKSLFTGND